MCTKNCLCNTCHKRNKCSDCPYIDMRDISNNPWSIVCSTTGIQSCDYYIEPPYVHHEAGYSLPRCDNCIHSQHVKSKKHDGYTSYCELLNRDVGQSAFGRNSPRECPLRRT